MRILAIVRRLPEQELAIRRLCHRDPDFLVICEDFDDAETALRRWEEAGPAYATRADEYRTLLGDFEEEILQGLERHGNPVRSHE